jgi:hypothetical protein
MAEQQEVMVETPQPKRRSRARRVGCAFVLVIWFALVLSPCLCIILATQGEILVHLGDVPGNEIRIWLVDEAHERGIGIASPTVSTTAQDANAVCVQTNVTFILWEGEGSPTHYCECYTREQQSGDWSPLTSASSEWPS